MSRGAWKSSFSPESRGYSGRTLLKVHCGGVASGVAVVLDVVLGPAEIAPASCQPLQVAWSSIYGAVAFGVPCGPGSCMRQRQR